jgi:hypothetical protein
MGSQTGVVYVILKARTSIPEAVSAAIYRVAVVFACNPSSKRISFVLGFV